MHDDARDFVIRQYANLVAAGLDADAARARLREVLGAAAVEPLADHAAPAATSTPVDTGISARLVEAVRRMNGGVADAQAAILHAQSEAQLFALDWWRPIRTFLLYVGFLLALAVAIAALYVSWILPVFGQLDQAMHVHGGAAGWITADGAVRVFVPLVLMAIAIAALALRWRRVRVRMARLESLAGRSRRRGRAAAAFDVLRCLQCAAALKAAGAVDAQVMKAALEVAGWPSGEALQTGRYRPGQALDQALRLGTFDAELAWQLRLGTSMALSRLELSRDRSILFARVLFYVLIGVMVTVLYLPLFSVASMIGVHG